MFIKRIKSLKLPWTSKPSTRDIGQLTEDFAAQYLAKQGLIYQEKNQHSRLGEIDLIMKDNDIIVFIAHRRTSVALFRLFQQKNSKKLEKQLHFICNNAV